MRPFQAVTLTSLLLALLACGTRTPGTTAGTPRGPREAPDWIDHEELPDGLGAVGIAQPNPMGDKALQRTVGIADARARLAGKLKVRVQSMFSQLNQQVTTAAADPTRKPVRDDVMNRVVENVTRQLVDQELAGTSLRATWTDPRDGSLYVFLVMTRDATDRALAGAARNQIRHELAQGEQSLAHALDQLDTAVAASR
jgi:hypothetical protein